MPVIDSKPTSDNPQTQALQNVQHADPYQQQFEDDTIDLYELWITLWNKKWLVIAVTAIAALGWDLWFMLCNSRLITKQRLCSFRQKQKMFNH